MSVPTSGAPIAALRKSHDRLRAVAGGLSPQRLRERGYPAEWSIAQVLSHLGSSAEIGRMALEAGLAGQEPPPREAYPPVWDRWNAKGPDEQAADGIAADAALVEMIEANAGSDATFSVWSGPTDIHGLAASRIFEHAVHTWDIAVVVDPAATLPTDAVEIILDGLGMLVGFTAKPAGWTGTVHVTTTDPAREFALTLGEKSSLEPWRDGPSGARLDLPAEALVRLVYGRLDADHTPPVAVSGIALDNLRTAFPGF
jgi:uncharacterized protein (TIGR03083 family)